MSVTRQCLGVALYTDHGLKLLRTDTGGRVGGRQSRCQAQKTAMNSVLHNAVDEYLLTPLANPRHSGTHALGILGRPDL